MEAPGPRGPQSRTSHFGAGRKGARAVRHGIVARHDRRLLRLAEARGLQEVRHHALRSRMGRRGRRQGRDRAGAEDRHGGRRAAALRALRPR